MPQNRLRGPLSCRISTAVSVTFTRVSSWGWTPAAGRCYLLSSSPRRRRQHVRRVVWRLVSGKRRVWRSVSLGRRQERREAGPRKQSIPRTPAGRQRRGWREGQVTGWVTRSWQRRPVGVRAVFAVRALSGARAREPRLVGESGSKTGWSGPGRSGPRGAGCPRVGGSFYFSRCGKAMLCCRYEGPAFASRRRPAVAVGTRLTGLVGGCERSVENRERWSWKVKLQSNQTDATQRGPRKRQHLWRTWGSGSSGSGR